MADFLMKLLGKSKVKVKTLNQARHLKKLCDDGNVLFDVKKNSANALEFTAYSKNIKKIKKQFSSSKEISVIPKSGLVKLFALLKANLVVFLCFVCCFISFPILNQYVWKIDVVAQEAQTKSEIMAYLKTEKIIERKLKSSYKTQEIKSKILEKFENVALCDVLIKGETLLINIEEKKFSLASKFSLSPLVCDFDCVIKKINITSGTAKVKQGDVVKQGTILVEPYVVRAGKFEACEVACEIEVEGTCKKTKTINECFSLMARSGRKVIKNYFTFSNNFDKIKQGKVKFDNFETEIICRNQTVFPIIPLRLTSVAYFELVEKEILINFVEKQQELENEFKGEVLLALGEILVLEENTQSNKVEDGKFEINYYVSFTKTIKKG